MTEPKLENLEQQIRKEQKISRNRASLLPVHVLSGVEQSTTGPSYGHFKSAAENISVW